MILIDLSNPNRPREDHPARRAGRSHHWQPSTLLRSFQMLRPLGDLAGYLTLWTRLHDRRATQAIWALTDWAHDHIPFPGAAFVDMVRRLSRENGLATGSVNLADRPRNSETADCPLIAAWLHVREKSD